MTKASEGIGDGGLALMRALANDRRKLVEWWKDYTGETVNKDSEPASKRRRGDENDGGVPPQNDPNAPRFPGDTGFPGGRNDPGGTSFPVDPPAGGGRVDPPAGGGRIDPPTGGRVDPPAGGRIDPPADPMTGGSRIQPPGDPMTGGRIDPMSGGSAAPRGDDPMTGGQAPRGNAPPADVYTGGRAPRSDPPADPITRGVAPRGIDPTTAGTTGRVDPMTGGGGMKVSGLRSVAPVSSDPIARGSYLPAGVMPKPQALEWLASRGDESSFALKQALSGKAA